MATPKVTTPRGLVAVTGGSGYIAGYCIAQLLNEGWRARTTVRNPGAAEEVRATIGKIAANPGAIEFVAADLNSDTGWADAVGGADYAMSSEPAHAAGEPVRVRGTVVSLDGSNLVVHAKDGKDVAITLADKFGAIAVVKASMADIRQGTFIGTATATQPAARAALMPLRESSRTRQFSGFSPSAAIALR